MIKKPARTFTAVAPPLAAPLTPAEAQFIGRFRTLSPEAVRITMSIFEGMYARCQEERMKARPNLRIVQGGQP